MKPLIVIYTDGSCNPVSGVGGWVAIILMVGEKIVLEGRVEDTTHQRMELIAVIKALDHLKANLITDLPITVFSDSQYVVDIRNRKEKMKASIFLTKKKIPIRNTDLLQALIQHMESLRIEFIKVQAHQKITHAENYNREADMRCRKIVRSTSITNALLQNRKFEI